jgi:alpha-tubulin suppressor-like RCC1 family protein
MKNVVPAVVLFVMMMSGCEEPVGGARFEPPFISAGEYHSLILKEDGSVWAAGYNYYGQLGTGDDENRSTFTQVVYSE